MDSEETRLYHFLWTAGILMLLIIFNFIRVMNRRHTLIRKAMEQQLDIQVKNADEQRTAIAAELHNDLQPFFNAMSQKIELMQLYPEQILVLGDEAQQLIDNSLVCVRDLSKMILPYKIRSNNLVEALEDFMARLHHQQPELIINHNELPVLKEEALLAVCRLLQEIIFNSIKHSRAEKLRIDFWYQENVLTIRTAEVGWQQKTRAVKAGKPGIGLELMESRIRLLNGTMHVNFDKANGIRYVIVIPITESQTENHD